jgi:hypothetical protein
LALPSFQQSERPGCVVSDLISSWRKVRCITEPDDVEGDVPGSPGGCGDCFQVSGACRCAGLDLAQEHPFPVEHDEVELEACQGWRQSYLVTGALSLVIRHIRETSEYPLLAAGTEDRLKVYLDLKDWVALAKARLGRPEFPHDGAAYEALRTATASGQVIVPLSATTYQELSRIVSLRQRTELANVIAEISGFVTITGRSAAMRHQVLAALAARYGGPEPAMVRPYGIGIQFATGDQRRLVLRGRDEASSALP